MNKQETLEEAAEIFVESKQFRTEQKDKSRRYCFIQGAKWQQEQERMYSEEEVKEILRSYADWSINGDCTYYEWFEQFKKK